MKSEAIKHTIFGSAVVLVILSGFFLPPVFQSPHYHAFLDQRTFLSIPNFADVSSSLLVVFIGVLGVRKLTNEKVKKQFLSRGEKWIFIIFFGAVILSGLGFAYYHWAPHDRALFWLRLPHSVTMSSFLAIALSDKVHPRLGVYALLPLIVLGIGSVVYWKVTSLNGSGDLRWYYYLCFLNFILMPLLFWLYQGNYKGTSYLVQSLIWLWVCRLNELFDKEIYALTWGQLSGHTVNHLLIALSFYFICLYVERREVRPSCVYEKESGGKS